MVNDDLGTCIGLRDGCWDVDRYWYVGLYRWSGDGLGMDLEDLIVGCDCGWMDWGFGVVWMMGMGCVMCGSMDVVGC